MIGELVESLFDFSQEVVFRLSGWYGQPEDEVLSRSLWWVFDRWERFQRAKYGDFTDQVVAVQAGTARAMSEKKPRPLPTFEEAGERAREMHAERTDPGSLLWWKRPPARETLADTETEEG